MEYQELLNRIRIILIVGLSSIALTISFISLVIVNNKIRRIKEGKSN